MDARVTKLVRLGVSEEDAGVLVAAGLDTPRKMKAASDEAFSELEVSRPACGVIPGQE